MNNLSKLFAICLTLAGCASSEIPTETERTSMAAALDAFEAGNTSLATSIFENQCARGERAACTQLGRLAEQQLQKTTAESWYKKACSLDDLFGCSKLGELYFKTGRLKEAKPLFEKSCAEIYWSCKYLGIVELAENNAGAAKKIFADQCNRSFVKSCILRGIVAENENNFKEAKKYYGQACNLNNSIGCSYLSLIEILLGNKEQGAKLVNKDCENGGSKTCRVAKLLSEIKKRPSVVQQWGAECQKKNGDSCYSLGLHQSLSLASLRKSKVTFKKACELGNGFGCLELGIFLSPYKDSEEYGRLMLEACEKGAAPSCTLLEDGTFPYKVKPANFLERGCDLGDGKACVELASKKWHTGQKAESLATYARACNKNYLEACFWKSKLGSENETEQLHAMKALCDRGYAQACGAFGDSLKEKDETAAKEYYHKGCKSYDQRSCYWEIELKSRREPNHNLADAVSRLCEQGYHYACYKSGKLSDDSGNIAKARIALTRGCELVDAESCAFLGYLADKENERAKARAYYRKACDYGSSFGCNNL